MPETRHWLTIGFLLATTGCGAPEGDDVPLRDGRGVERGAAPAGTLSGAPMDDPRRVAPADTDPWVVDRPTTDTPDPSGWTTGPSTGGTPGGITLLRTVRSARQDGYDRVVFEFESRVPAWRIDYVDSPQHECGSGDEVRVAGDGWLHVAFEPANAHTEEGRPTAQRRLIDPAGENLREIRRICDFEAHVDYVIGVGSPNRYRAFVLERPERLVVDIRH